MRNIYNLFTKSLFALVCLFLTISVVAQDYPSLTISSGDITITQEEEATPTAEYRDSTGEVQNVKIKWHTEPGFLGKVDKNGVLKPNHAGDGFLIAKYGELRDSVVLIVEGTPKGNDDEEEVDDGDDDSEYPKVKVIPGSIKVPLGDSVELRAFYIDSLDTKIDTIFSWSVEPSNLGMFPDSLNSMFHSAELGKGIIIATLGDLADTIKVSVIENKNKPPKHNGNSGKQLTITPGDTVVYFGSDMIQYSASYKTNGNKHQGLDFIWSVSNENVATIDSSGLITLAGETGMAIVSVQYSNFKASVELLVVDSLYDTNLNTIAIHRVLPNGQELKARVFNEGESYKIGGLPFPLNALNGGMLHFPFGCVDEDVVIYMFIPERYANMNDDSTEVVFNEEIITGVKFSVKPASSDTIVEPFYFNVPVELCMVFKHELLDSLGVTPENLDVFFANSTGFITDGTGNVVVDTVKNKIYSSIEHFSTIVVRRKSVATETYDLKMQDETFSVFPNPFSSTTQILYSVTNDIADVNMAIYNIYGQKVKDLVHQSKLQGTYSVIWDGTNESGAHIINGIYFCRLIQNGTKPQVKKIIISR